jgi:Flp pilus assembly protein TadG
MDRYINDGARMIRSPRCRRPRERGQALAETGIVLLIVVALTMAVVDFGRMLMLLNMVTSATRDAARVASAVAYADRSATGVPCAAAKTAIKQLVINQLSDVGLAVNANNVAINQTAAVGVNTPATITVTTSVSIPWVALFNLVGSSLPVSKSVTFKDESPVGAGSSC